MGFPGNSDGKESSAMQETRVQSLGQEDLLEKGRKSTPVFLPREFHRQRSLVGGSVIQSPPARAGEEGSIPLLGRSPGEADGNPLQDFCLENPMDRGACGLQIIGSQRVRHNGSK